MSSKIARRRAREFALQGIYQFLLSGNSARMIESHFETVSGFDKVNRELFIELLRGVVAERTALEARFAPFLSRGIQELSPVEHAVLLMATQELLNRIETPYRVVINEAIELAKTYGGTDGHRFVNGVLDRLAAQLRPEEVAARRETQNKPAADDASPADADA